MSNCSSCGTVVTYPCTTCHTCTPPVCGGCSTTLNADCIIFNKDKLCYEPDSVTNNSSRTLTSVLQAACNLSGGLVESVFMEDSFTLDSDDNNKIINLIDGEVNGAKVITLPVSSLDYAGKVFTFLNRSTAAVSTWTFSQQIATDYDPLSTSDVYTTLQTSSHGIIKLGFIKTTPTSYAWVLLN